MQVIPIPCLTDNYAYIINDNISKTVGVIDPSEANPIISVIAEASTIPEVLSSNWLSDCAVIEDMWAQVLLEDGECKPNEHYSDVCQCMALSLPNEDFWVGSCFSGVLLNGDY